MHHYRRSNTLLKVTDRIVGDPGSLQHLTEKSVTESFPPYRKGKCSHDDFDTSRLAVFD